MKELFHYIYLDFFIKLATEWTEFVDVLRSGEIIGLDSKQLSASPQSCLWNSLNI